MLKNYFKIAIRNLLKYKFISFINLFGLTVGFTCCLLITAYIFNELSYDKFNNKAHRVYRVTRSFNIPNGAEVLHLSAVAPPTGPLLKNDFPDIEKITRILGNGNTAVKYKDKLFNENNAWFADENLFDFFSVPVLQGNAKTALALPYSVMLTKEMARKYFGDEDPMNKMIKIDRQFTFKVTGLFEDFPANSHFHPGILLSFSTLNDSAVYGANQLATNWGNNSFYTYLLFPENYPVAKIESQFPDFIDKNIHFAGAAQSFKPSSGTKLYLQKLTDIHLRSHLDDELEENGDIKRVYIFSAIALFILLIACINYMNLSTARSVLRAKEIGVRKVAGAERKEIIAQFLSESVMLTWLALILAVLLTLGLLPYLNKLSGEQLSINILLRWPILLCAVLLPFVVGTISGIYPALFMSSFDPVKVLKGVFNTGTGNISFRKVLVVAQFSISIILIIATAIVFEQLNYMQQASLGYNKDHVINVPYTDGLNAQFETFRNDLLKNTSVKNLGRSSRIPTGRLLDAQDTKQIAGDSIQPMNLELKYVTVDYDFIPTYNIEFAAGRNFSRAFSTDTGNYVINEAAAAAMGWKLPGKALGKDIIYGGAQGKIIGVTKDFHFESMHQKIVPLLMRMPSLNPGGYGNLSIKISGDNIASTLDNIQNTWYRLLPESPFTYSFLDEKYDQLYKSEQKQGTIFTIFSCIAIFIACLGLFGLSAFTITQRIKEIGVRKVLGASIFSIVSLLSKDFLKLVAIAAVLAFPLAWFAMYTWLQDFAYRIHISWSIFILAGVIAACIALFTISFQAIKAALANPVKSLRTE